MILGLRRYRVSRADREPLLRFMLDGLIDAGCRIIRCSEPNEAPFVITFETSAGERLGVVAYAFLANRRLTRNRPPDERRFQIKYGSRDGVEHGLWQDPLGLFTTLLVGIDPEEGYLVAADPEMHNPTKLFISLEFKDRHAEAIKREGWFGWERERKGPLAEPVETLIGCRRERLLDLIRFERAARGFPSETRGLPPGDRLLLSEKPDLFTGSPVGSKSANEADATSLHPLVAAFELSSAQILDLIAGARRLKMAVRGWVAEEKLRETLSTTDGVTFCERLDEEGGPDLRIRWKDGPPLTVECKNVLRGTNAKGLARIDFQRTRASKSDPCSRYYAPDDFDVVAGCLHAVSERWEFKYLRPAALREHSKCPGKLASNVVVDSLWSTNPGQVFASAEAALS